MLKIKGVHESRVVKSKMRISTNIQFFSTDLGLLLTIYGLTNKGHALSFVRLKRDTGNCHKYSILLPLHPIE